MIPIYVPYLEKYKKSALQAIETSWISNYGMNVTNAEQLFKKILQINYCILMNNGTSATHALFLALKYKYPKITKIYIPNNVFVAPWNCALREYSKEYLEVMKMDSTTLNIDTSEEYIKTLQADSCVLIVHNLGNIVNVPRLHRLRPDIIFIEDNCEGIFGTYEGIYSGTSTKTLCSAVSFYANKTLTTGEGGAFFTNDKDVYTYIKSIYSHGMTATRYIHDTLAYNYRMTNIQAGFLYDQLQDIDHILTLKKNVFDTYDRLLQSHIQNNKIYKLTPESNTVSANWLYCIIIKNIHFNHFEHFMNEKKIQIRPFFYDIRKHQHLQNINCEYKEENIASQGVMLPSFPELQLYNIQYIVSCINEYITSL